MEGGKLSISNSASRGLKTSLSMAAELGQMLVSFTLLRRMLVEKWAKGSNLILLSTSVLLASS